MGFFRKLFIVILCLSFIVFCALFGSLPRLRKTPIGWINRFIWIKIPGSILQLDGIITGGRSIRTLKRLGHYLMHTNHPLVLIMYISLLIAGQAIFIPPVHQVLPWSWALPIYPLAVLPYYFTYRCVASTASFISLRTLPTQMQEYPYDHVLFRPGLTCVTCNVVKPARSKHCRLCGYCVHRMDHHCIWVSNCLGRENYPYFLAMLLSLALMLAYGSFLAWRVLDATIQDAVDAHHSLQHGTGAHRNPHEAQLSRGQRWSHGITWNLWFDRWTWVFASHVRVGAVGLLAAMTAPLAAGLLGYHLYLIRAGMTTNESFKWEEWSEDVSDGYVYQCQPREARVAAIFNGPKEDMQAGNGYQSSTIQNPFGSEFTAEPPTSWPIQPQQRLVSRANKASLETELAPHAILGEEPWIKVEAMADVINVYDLGFWENLKDALGMRQ